MRDYASIAKRRNVSMLQKVVRRFTFLLYKIHIGPRDKCGCHMHAERCEESLARLAEVIYCNCIVLINFIIINLTTSYIPHVNICLHEMLSRRKWLSHSRFSMKVNFYCNIKNARFRDFAKLYF